MWYTLTDTGYSLKRFWMSCGTGAEAYKAKKRHNRSRRMVFPRPAFLPGKTARPFADCAWVAMTRPPCSAKYRWFSRPMPEDARDKI